MIQPAIYSAYNSGNIAKIKYFIFFGFADVIIARSPGTGDAHVFYLVNEFMDLPVLPLVAAGVVKIPG